MVAKKKENTGIGSESDVKEKTKKKGKERKTAVQSSFARFGGTLWCFPEVRWIIKKTSLGYNFGGFGTDFGRLLGTILKTFSERAKLLIFATPSCEKIMFLVF